MTVAMNERENIDSRLNEKIKYTREVGMPIWNGEFSLVYASSNENSQTLEQVNV